MNQLRSISVLGEAAYTELLRLRAEYPRSGLYPVCLGDAANRDEIIAGLPTPEVISATIEESRTIDPVAWLAERAEQSAGAPEEGEWPADINEQDNMPTVEDEITEEPDKRLLIGLFKVTASWEVFAHLDWGGWNECPMPAEQCALHRYWGAQYGSEIYVITDSVVRSVTSRPPDSREAALTLAREQYAYAPDIVDQGLPSVAALAAALMDSPDWFFWWD